MTISGFTIAKNADKLYYPIKQSIMSVLPIVDEFIVVLGNCDDDDNTRREIESIESDKIKIIDTIWDIEKYPDGTENAHQTDIAKNACSGNWLFYLQADEVVHEKYLPAIIKRCEELLNDKKTDGLLFQYRHFWGDYDHYQIAHGWYPYEIRIIRNDAEIHSWQDAQSFRRIPGFDNIHYRQQKGTCKLGVAKVDAYIFHYGWVRPPGVMRKKGFALDTMFKGHEKTEELYKNKCSEYDYGPLNLLPEFKETHPAVMKDRIAQFNWQDKLQYSGKPNPNRHLHKHEKLKNKILTFIEHSVLNGKQIGGFKNYTLLQ